MQVIKITTNEMVQIPKETTAVLLIDGESAVIYPSGTPVTVAGDAQATAASPVAEQEAGSLGGLTSLLGALPGVSGLLEIADLPSAMSSIIKVLQGGLGTLSSTAKEQISSSVSTIATVLNAEAGDAAASTEENTEDEDKA